MVNWHTKRQLFVRALSARATRGWLTLGHLRFPCALGRSGRRALKREGDGATPFGAFAVREGFYRADRMTRPRTGLPLRPLTRDQGWCDTAGDRNYNRPIRHPYPGSVETMWRADHLYDLVLVLGYNDRPRIQGRGSAIFVHAARDGFRPTQGCVALRRSDLLKLVTRLPRDTRIRTGP